MNPQLLEQAKALNINEQIELMEAIWDGIASTGNVPPLTDAQSLELNNRLEDHLSHPNQALSWEKVKVEAIAQSIG